VIKKGKSKPKPLYVVKVEQIRPEGETTIVFAVIKLDGNDVARVQIPIKTDKLVSMSKEDFRKLLETEAKKHLKLMEFKEVVGEVTL